MDVNLYPENQGYETASNLFKQLQGRRNSLETRLPGSIPPPCGQLMVGSTWTKPKGKSLPLAQICILLEDTLQGRHPKLLHTHSLNNLNPQTLILLISVGISSTKLVSFSLLNSPGSSHFCIEIQPLHTRLALGTGLPCASFPHSDR